MPLPSDRLREYNAVRTCVDKGSICHAPESSMYFGRDGLVSACCYSRNAALGRYPDNSVEEIWNSAQAVSMRAAMRRNELPDGCELCADQLAAGNVAGFHARQFDQNARSLRSSGLMSRLQSFLNPSTNKHYPVQLEFELSNKCNLECAMCSGFFSSSIRANREHLPALPQIYDAAFVEQLTPFIPHLKRAKFLGGEPFLIDIYYEIWDQLIELNPRCEVSITTNGTVYTEKVKRVLEKLNCGIIVSLDSIVKPTYESIRQNATFERTMANFKVFCDFNRKNDMGLSIAVCPMVSNALEIPGLVDFATESGVRVYFNTVVFPQAHSLRGLPADRKREILALYRAGTGKSNGRVAEWNRNALEDLCRQIEFWLKEEDIEIPEMDPLQTRCANLLTGDSISTPLRNLLIDVVYTRSHIEASDLVQLTEVGPVEELKAYFKALWELGALLEAEGLLPGTRFDREQELLFLEHLHREVEPAQARRIYDEARPFSKMMLRFVGTMSAAQLTELVQSHVAAVP